MLGRVLEVGNGDSGLGECVGSFSGVKKCCSGGGGGGVLHRG